MCVISLIVFTDKEQRTHSVFYTKMVFHYVLIIQYQNKVMIHLGIQNDIVTNNSLLYNIKTKEGSLVIIRAYEPYTLVGPPA